MYSEPRPVEVRHAVIGAILIALALYIGGGAIWSWLFWKDQHLDASRLWALLFAWVAFMGGLTLIQKWLAGEWVEWRKSRPRDTPYDPPPPGTDTPGSAGDAPTGDSGPGPS